ncbi:MAG: hypothetical protein K2P78_05925, partial [Gemmataceae bacterium]|nr:hypothetical protein [Gemmataceae bacterium]
DAEDYRRRVLWGEAAGAACDAVCGHGDHRRDWSPHLLSVEPVLVTAKPGDEVKASLRVTDGRDPVTVWACVAGQPGVAMTARPVQDATRPVNVRVPVDASLGRRIIPMWAAPSQDREGEQLTDTYLVIDVSAR